MSETFDIDARIAATQAELRRRCEALVEPGDPAAARAAEYYCTRLAELLPLLPSAARLAKAARLVLYSPTWRGYEEAPPVVQGMMDAYNEVVGPLIEDATAELRRRRRRDG